MTEKAIVTLLTILPLTFHPASVHAAPETIADPPAPTLEQPDPTTIDDEVVQADYDANLDPVEAAPRLASALDELNTHGDVFAGNEEVLENRRMARLNLARAYLERGEDDLAREAMDTAIRESLGQNLPVEDFGEEIEELYFERMTALQEAGWVTLEIECELACEVFLDENKISAESMELPPGPYRIVVHSPKGEREDLRETIELDSAASPKLIEFRPPPPPIKPPVPVETPKRIMPLGAEVALVVLGTGLSMAGAGLTGLGATANGNRNLVGVGVPFMLAGVALLTTGSVSLALDQTRVGKVREQRAVLSWKMHF